MKLAEIISVIESHAPLALQESYDNAGLAVGDAAMEVRSALLCIDVTEKIIEEAIQTGANLIISHHPVLFHPLKKLTGSAVDERIVIAAIRNNLALYSAHTNLDNILPGVNSKICSKLNLSSPEILVPKEGVLMKLVTFVPSEHEETVRNALFNAGAGHIGQYDQCSFNASGQGSFRALPGTHPYAGEIDKFHLEKETRIETVFPSYLEKQIIRALLASHPYEEAAYDIYRIENKFEMAGSGMVGELEKPMSEKDFFQFVKDVFHCGIIRCSPLLNKPVRKIALCGGSGSFLAGAAMVVHADVFLTGDVKYHQFFEADGRIVIADIGHYESEQFTIEIFYELLTKKLPNFAVHFSRINTNCITYL
jgi:dinuclear metal center YbgI/SA1388 family protein